MIIYEFNRIKDKTYLNLSTRKMSKLAGPVTSKRRKDRWREPRSEYVSGAASYFANAAATNPSYEVHKFTARRGRREVLDGKKKTKSTVFPLGRMHRREVHASQPYGLLSSGTFLSLARILISKLRERPSYISRKIRI